MRSFSRDVFILSAKRTPFGTYGGALKDWSATDLGVHASKAAIAASEVPKDEIDHVIFGNVLQTSRDAIYLARHIGLKSGIPESVPALTLNRLCGSGFQALISAAEQIVTEQADVVLAGGTESMSQAPHVIRGARFGLPLGKGELEDSLWASLTDTFVQLPMALTAENLAEKYEITQDEVDRYAAQSQKRFAAAQSAGRFDAEIAPIEIVQKKATTVFSKDEHNRPETTVESLRKLPKIFKQDGVIHAGAASGICDGAAAFVVASREYTERRGLRPLARVLNWGIAGCDPKIMGIGPAPAIRRALERSEAVLTDFDLIEVNEAFAPQVLAVMKELDLPEDRLNVDGGAIAVGHPLGASGARITAHLVHELRRSRLRYGLGSACIGGGQGIAVILEGIS